MEIVRTAHQEKSEDMLIHRWAVAYQSVMSYDEFKRRIGVDKTTNVEQHEDKTEEEILSTVRGILNGDI